MLTIDQIKAAVQGIECVYIKWRSAAGVRFSKDSYVVEILTDCIAVKNEEDDNLSWEFIHNPTLEDVESTIADPGWFI